MYVTYSELFALMIVIIELIALVVEFIDKLSKESVRELIKSDAEKVA